MLKKILCLLAVLTLFAVYPAAAEETSPLPVTTVELSALLESIQARILDEAPLNDPSEESAQSEDGTLFWYEIAQLYAEGSRMTAETPINVLVFKESEIPVLRGTGIDTLLADLLAAFPLENKELAGTREEALLYLRDTADGGFAYGRILRDGQRISAAEYGEMIPEGDQFRHTSITYTFLRGMVASIRVDGLTPSAGLTDISRAEELHTELAGLASHDEYCMIKTSQNGLDLTPFDENDLVFDGFSYTLLQPLTLPGSPERELMDNEDGTWLMRCDGDGYTAVFLCDEQGKNAGILSFSILDDEMEGPRCIRLGDLFSDDFSRFRNGEGEMTEDLTELLYGAEDAVPRGTACYDPENMSLSYVTETSSGLQVELLLKYENSVLTEIILQTL